MVAIYAGQLMRLVCVALCTGIVLVVAGIACTPL
ncbi:hypothetical protein GGD67_003851 [Bradyrhizobium sp. IAR9]|nr:hypothetical protein [Bradyrhizobium sp. IAR9]